MAQARLGVAQGRLGLVERGEPSVGVGGRGGLLVGVLRAAEAVEGVLDPFGIKEGTARLAEQGEEVSHGWQRAR